MSRVPVLTIAVPTYNMERWLVKNLSTYQDTRFDGILEVLCINNASTDGSKEIIKDFCQRMPNVFSLVDRTVDDYGQAINQAIELCHGKYFRIVDADDWVDTDELFRFIKILQNIQSDVVLSDYEIIHMQTGTVEKVFAKDKGAEYGKIYTDAKLPMQTLPSVHATTYRTELLRKNGVNLIDGLYFLDEIFVIEPYLYAKTVVYTDCNVYRYQIGNPGQSVAPKNRAKHYDSRREILCELIKWYQKGKAFDYDSDAKAYCRKRIELGVGDHFTTLYIYIADRQEGRHLAKEWKRWLHNNAPEFWRTAQRKAYILYLINLLGISLSQYERLKGMLLLKSRKKKSLYVGRGM